MNTIDKKNYLIGCAGGILMAPIVQLVIKKLTGHVFTKLPIASSWILGASVGLLIFGIDRQLDKTFLSNKKPLKELSSFVITQLICVGGTAAVLASSTGLMSVAITVAAVWLGIKGTDSVINKFFPANKITLKENNEIGLLEKSIKECNCKTALELFQDLGIDKIIINACEDYSLFEKDNKKLELNDLKEKLKQDKFKKFLEFSEKVISDLKQVVNTVAFEKFTFGETFEKLEKLGIELFHYKIIKNLFAENMNETSPRTLIQEMKDLGFKNLESKIQKDELIIKFQKSSN